MSRRHIDSFRDFLTRPCADTSRYLGRRTGGRRRDFLLFTHARIGMQASGLALTPLVAVDIASPHFALRVREDQPMDVRTQFMEAADVLLSWP